ncbi:hypothetical protein SAMD00024442_31_29 [Candidatus Symbiothrix dinenymphae]|nr:hypothetical protein SAMD00024442_31_29 [Candidatus Symbiothrix dinenymphae]
MKRIAFFVLGAILSGSCNDDMGDSVKNFVTDETVYPAKFDKAVAYTGYENVEIDLLNAGRIPSSEIHLAKAKKTLVVYGDTELVIDSVCSWVKITGLTQRTTYKFIVYTMDEKGNKSVPEEVFRAPFTAADKELLAIPVPAINRITPTQATVEWRQDITSVSLKYLGKLVYSYTDKDGMPREVTLDDTPAQPSFTVENFPVAGDTLHMQYRVIPKVSNVQIIDTIWLERALVIPAL